MTGVQTCALPISLKKNKSFQWTSEQEVAFQELKNYLSNPLLLAKPKPDEPLPLYLSVTESSVSAVLVREEDGKQPEIAIVSLELFE